MVYNMLRLRKLEIITNLFQYIVTPCQQYQAGHAEITHHAPAQVLEAWSREYFWPLSRICCLPVFQSIAYTVHRHILLVLRYPTHCLSGYTPDTLFLIYRVCSSVSSLPSGRSFHSFLTKHTACLFIHPFLNVCLLFFHSFAHRQSINLALCAACLTPPPTPMLITKKGEKREEEMY